LVNRSGDNENHTLALKITEPSFTAAILTDLGITAILFAGLYFVPLPQILPCTFPLAEKLTLALCAALLIQAFAFIKRYHLRERLLIASINIGLSLLVLWLGNYPISPLGFSNGRIPIAQGFILTRLMRTDQYIASGETINLAGGSTTAIAVKALPVDRKCFWLSTKGGALDDSGDCNIVYMPPTNSDFDLLKAAIQPACHLPAAEESIKILVLP
jgi:hypothetical protein